MYTIHTLHTHTQTHNTHPKMHKMYETLNMYCKISDVLTTRDSCMFEQKCASICPNIQHKKIQQQDAIQF